MRCYFSVSAWAYSLVVAIRLMRSSIAALLLVLACGDHRDDELALHPPPAADTPTAHWISGSRTEDYAVVVGDQEIARHRAGDGDLEVKLTSERWQSARADGSLRLKYDTACGPLFAPLGPCTEPGADDKTCSSVYGNSWPVSKLELDNSAARRVEAKIATRAFQIAPGASSLDVTIGDCEAQVVLDGKVAGSIERGRAARDVLVDVAGTGCYELVEDHYGRTVTPPKVTRLPRKHVLAFTMPIDGYFEAAPESIKVDQVINTATRTRVRRCGEP
jgi:hypothetical protein